jgi:hypothetical protein
MSDGQLPATKYERTLQRSANLRALPDVTLIEVWEHEAIAVSVLLFL